MVGTKKTNHAEYIWLDGTSPTQGLRSKTKVLFHQENRDLNSFPQWSFDGSSTNQASQSSSDCVLQPVFFSKDPLKLGDHFLVLCEVLHPDGTPHPSNKRAELRAIMEQVQFMEPYIGFEQEYTLLVGGVGTKQWPLGWPKDGTPGPQGPFYCGVGNNKVYGREIVEEHATACEMAGLNLYGINAEVMPSQWEFQIGYRGGEEAADPLTMSDHLWVARYLLKRVAEKHSVSASFSNKPLEGDWNGAGLHTNFSTKKTRDKKNGMEAIHAYIAALEKSHDTHIQSYGEGLEKRLTGQHETCHIGEFKSGISHRGASIRIPLSTHKNNCGYIEDRRPGANADPYVVSFHLLNSTLGKSLEPLQKKQRTLSTKSNDFVV